MIKIPGKNRIVVPIPLKRGRCFARKMRPHTSAPMTTSRHPIQFPLKLAHILSSCSELDYVIEERTVSFHD